MGSTTSEHVRNISLQVTIDNQLVTSSKQRTNLLWHILFIKLYLTCVSVMNIKLSGYVGGKTLSTVVDYLICGLIKTKLILNSLYKYYII